MSGKRIAVLAIGLILIGTAAYKCGSAREIPVIADTTEVVEVTQALSQEKSLEAPIEIDTEIPLEKGAHIAVVVKSTSGEFWKKIRQGMEDGIKYLNAAYGLKGEEQLTMTFEGPDTANELTDLLNAVDAVLAENPSVLCLAAGDENAGEAQLETARDNGIPVILLDSLLAIDEDLYATYCGSDDMAMGREAAGRLADALEDEGQVAIISHWKADQTSTDRVEGFKKGLRKQAKGVELVGELTVRESSNLNDELYTLLEENPNLAGLFCTNMDAAAAALSAAENLKLENLKIVGIDGSSRQIEAIRQGQEVGVVSQNPYQMGFAAIYAAVRATAGEQELEKNIYTDWIWIDGENVDHEEIAPYIYK